MNSNIKAYDFLSEIRRKDAMINNKCVELYQLRCMITNTTAMMSADPVQSSPSDRIGKTVAKIADLENRINIDIDAFVDDKAMRIKVIEQLSDPIEYDVIHRRFVQFQSLEEISKEIHYTRQWVYEKYRSGLTNIQKILDSTETVDKII